MDSWTQGVFIFAMACVGNFAFASATQGWFITRNKVWEIPLLLGVTYIMMQPGFVAKFLGVPDGQRYWCYLIGLALWGAIYLIQRPRAQRDKLAAQPA